MGERPLFTLLTCSEIFDCLLCARQWWANTWPGGEWACRKVPREHRFYFFCGGERTDSKQISRVVLAALRVGGDWVVWRGLLQVMTIRRSPWWEIQGTECPGSRNGEHRGSKSRCVCGQGEPEPSGHGRGRKWGQRDRQGGLRARAEQGSNRISVWCVKKETLSLCPGKLFRPSTALNFCYQVQLRRNQSSNSVGDRIGELRLSFFIKGWDPGEGPFTGREAGSGARRPAPPTQNGDETGQGNLSSICGSTSFFAVWVLNLRVSYKMRVMRLPWRVIVWPGDDVHGKQSLAGWQVE